MKYDLLFFIGMSFSSMLCGIPIGIVIERASPDPPDAPTIAPSAPPLPCEPLDCPERVELLVLERAFGFCEQSVRNLETALKECRAKPSP